MSQDLYTRRQILTGLGLATAATALSIGLPACGTKPQAPKLPCDPSILPDSQEFLRNTLELHNNNRYTKEPVTIPDKGTLNIYYDQQFRELNPAALIAIAAWTERGVKRAAEDKFQSIDPEALATYSPHIQAQFEPGSSIIFAEEPQNSIHRLGTGSGEILEFMMPGPNGDVSIIWAHQESELLLRSTIVTLAHHHREIPPNKWTCTSGIEITPGSRATEIVANAMGGLIVFAVTRPLEQQTYENYRLWQKNETPKIIFPGQNGNITVDSAAIDEDTFNEFYAHVLPTGPILTAKTAMQYSLYST